MAIFKKTPEKKEVMSDTAKTTKTPVVIDKKGAATLRAKARRIAPDEIIRRPRITERATDLAEKGVYVFEVHAAATKSEVKEAINRLFKVHAVTVRTISVPAKYTKSRSTNRLVLKKAGVKKALVTLRAGEKIEMV